MSTLTSDLKNSRCSALNPERAAMTRLLKFDKTIIKALGSWLYDDTGRRYLDFSSQYGVMAFGYNPAFLWDVLHEIEQCAEPSFIQPLVSPAAERLAQLLSDTSPGGSRITVFCNSGAEAVEAAIKVARSQTDRSMILSTENSFHGKTLGAASATGTPIYSVPFKVDTTQFTHIPYDDLAALEKRLQQADVAAFIVEPIQGEGGMISPSAGYLSGAQELCKKYGTLFIVDEVQTGLGRTGKLFACEWDGLDPDIVLLAKALGGGLVPIAACLIAESVWHKNMGLFHSSTFANNHLTCRVALKAVETLLADDGALLAQVRTRADLLHQRLHELVQRYPRAYAGVRGRGLLVGLELNAWPADESYFLGMANHKGYRVPLVSGYLLNEHGLIVLPTVSRSNVLRIQPALLISNAEIEQAMQALAEVGNLIQTGRFDRLISYATAQPAAQAHSESQPQPTQTETKLAAQPRDKHLGRFAFLIHPTDADDLLRSLPDGCQDYPAEQIERLKGWITDWQGFDPTPAAVHFTPRLQSKTGGYVDGWLISSMLTPRQMLRLRSSDREALMAGYLQVAHSVGADIIGLGAFTSVITHGGLSIADSATPLTTGNSLTAMMCVQGLLRAAQYVARPLHQQTIAIIGASGSIGRLAALEVSAQCRRLILFGNPANPGGIESVRAVAGEIYQYLLNEPEHTLSGLIAEDIRALKHALPTMPAALLADSSEISCLELERLVHETFCHSLNRTAPILTSIDLREHLPKAEAIISATSNGRSFIEASWLNDQAIVCDAARPGDVQSIVRQERPDLFFFEGGLVQLPEAISFGRNNILGFPQGVNLACLSETIVLAMSQAQQHHSLGRRIALKEARTIARLAQQHGFECYLPRPVHQPKTMLSKLTSQRVIRQPEDNLSVLA